MGPRRSLRRARRRTHRSRHRAGRGGRRGVPRALPREGRRARRAGARRRGRRARADRVVGRPAADVRAPPLRDEHGRPDARRARRAAGGEGRGARDPAPLLRARVGGRPGRRGGRAARRRGARPLAPPSPLGPEVPPVPPHRAGGEDRHREDRLRRRGVVATLRGAARRAPRLARRRGGLARDGDGAALRHRPRRAPHGRRGDHRGARPRPSHADVRLQHDPASTSRSTTGCAATRRGSRRATSRTRRPTRPSRRSSRRRRRATTSPQRYYRLKARLLGLERLDHYDRFAPIAADTSKTSWDDARTIVVDAYSDFSDEAGGIVARFFDDSWIDAPVRPDKRTGAFCATTVPGRPPVHPHELHRRPPLDPHARARARARPARRPVAAARATSTRRRR